MEKPFELSGKKVVVTGGCGYIGSRLVNALIKKSCTVIVVDDLSEGDKNRIPLADAREGRQPEGWLNNNAILLAWNLESIGIETLSGAFDGADVIFHLAAKRAVAPSLDDRKSYHLTNVEGTRRVLEACASVGIPRLVFASSSSVYGACTCPESGFSDGLPLYPLSVYAATKAACEAYIMAYARSGLIPSATCLRYYNVFGPRQSYSEGKRTAIDIFTTSMLDKNVIMVHGGTGPNQHRRDFTYIDDVVDATIAAGIRPNVRPVYDIGRGSPVGLGELVYAIGELLEITPLVSYKNAEPFDMPYTCADVGAAVADLGLNVCRDFTSALWETVREIRDEYKERQDAETTGSVS